jgi:hypothetical protein
MNLFEAPRWKFQAPEERNLRRCRQQKKRDGREVVTKVPSRSGSFSGKTRLFADVARFLFF